MITENFLIKKCQKKVILPQNVEKINFLSRINYVYNSTKKGRIFRCILPKKMNYSGKLTCSIANEYVDDFASFAEFFLVLYFTFLNESCIKLIAYKIDGTATKASTHNT